ncbi:DNA internalization-related competence protein ComEC/Rec2 [Amphritea pacifica]|uniref:DNA internalization-related competence protein ComEC/Rec2 n=1 Tax=Amphritea pacifica TaxID=2811233 RepID=UPI001962F400|nr:DNA internalization-related competence protein ComEC/Rec2 [Amphritea pacifica]MBN1007846.1 DNA internalization-related competence protein ComEC/Rec2 [Amphritea pacifica]
MIGIALGVLLVAWLPRLISFPALTLLLALLLLLCLLPSCRIFLSSGGRIQIAGLLFGVVYASGWGYLNLSQRMPMDMSAQEISVSGTVTGLPQNRPAMIRFSFDVDHYSPTLPGTDLKHLQLSWYHPEGEIVPGQQWQLKVRLKPPRGLMNPGGSDYETRLFAEQINARGYLLSARLIRGPGESGAQQIAYLRYRIAQWLSRLSLTDSSEATIRALLLGDKQGLKDDQWRILRQTGTVHLVVISGLHIAIACLIGYWLGSSVQWLAGRILPGQADIRAYRIVPALLLASSYALLAGFSIPTQRALIMALSMLLPGLFNRHLGIWTRYQLALVVVLLLQPLSFYQPGFWLSFAAVGALLLSTAANPVSHRLKAIVTTQWSVSLGLFPLLLFWLGQVALIAPLVNIVAIPLLTFILIPGVVLGLLLCLLNAELGSALLNGLLNQFWLLLQVCAPSDGQAVLFSRPALLPVLLGGLAALLLNLPRWMGVGFFALLMLTVLIFPPEQPVDQGGFRATVADVGQGLAVLIETNSKSVLFDTGAAYRGRSTARFTLIPMLESRNISQLDRLIISHKDNDHAGGYADLAETLTVNGLDSGSPAIRRRLPAQPCTPGDSWEWDGVRFSYIQPARLKQTNENNRSCVLLVQSENCSILIPGDIESSVEQQILNEHPGLHVNWLVAAHHGSRFSSSVEWLNGLRPDWVLFSSGFDNPYGHPAREIIDRLQLLKLNWLNTSDRGAVIIQSSADHCLTESYRDQKKRYWSAG